MKNVNHTLNYNGHTYSYSFQGVCPNCHCYFEPAVKYQATYNTSVHPNLIHYEIYECPACFKPFIVIWEAYDWYSDHLTLSRIAPSNFKKSQIPSLINCTVYSAAHL